MGNAGSVWPTAIWPKSKGCITNLGRNMSDTSILREGNSDHALCRWTHDHSRTLNKGGALKQQGIQWSKRRIFIYFFAALTAVCSLCRDR